MIPRVIEKRITVAQDPPSHVHYHGRITEDLYVVENNGT